MPEGIIIVSTKAHYLCPFHLKPKDVTILAVPEGMIIVSTEAHYLYSFHLTPEGHHRARSQLLLFIPFKAQRHNHRAQKNHHCAQSHLLMFVPFKAWRHNQCA